MNLPDHEEQQLGKPYDARLFRRLLSYTLPHKKLLVLALVMVMLITGSELAGPYLIKVAIDDHIQALDTPMAAFSPGEEPAGAAATPFAGKIFVRETELELKQPPSPALERYQIVEQEGSHYLVRIDRSYAVEQRGGDYEMISAKQLTDDEVSLFREQDVKALIKLGGIYFFLISVAFLLNYTQTYTLNHVAQRIIFALRGQIFSHLQGRPFSFFDRNPVGRLVTRVTNDTETLNEMYGNVLVNLFKDFFMLAGIIIVMLNLNVKLALLSFLALPLIIGAAWAYRRWSRDTFRQVRVLLARINTTVNENLTGMRIVHIFNREKQQYQELEEINRSHFRASLRELHLTALFRPVMDFIYALSLAVLIWWGGGGIVQGALEFGVLYAFIEYVNRFFKPINDLTEKYTVLQQAMASAERIFLLLDNRDEIKDPEAPVELPAVRGEIAFQNVWFAYNEGEWVLKDVSFHVRPGETVAIVGATGAGKSSLINLLCRFYDVQKGAITIDGVDIRQMRKAELRKLVGIVLQDVFLFSGDIKSNIRLYNEEISDEQVREVCEYVNASSFIEKLPHGYDEEVKERGITLSTGQRQLLAFARALAFDPAILVLDEATANIDTETEHLIQEAMRKISRNRTTLIIAHRLSTIRDADKIIVLHKGLISETGTHGELMQRKGIYSKLYELQYKEQFAATKKSS